MALASAAWRAPEGARAALAFAFTVLKRDRVISLIHPENHPSIRVAERLGESLQGRIDFCGRQVLCYGIEKESDSFAHHSWKDRLCCAQRTRPSAPAPSRMSIDP
jgi:RimJ/RimL family protein N-acetyltransferase